MIECKTRYGDIKSFFQTFAPSKIDDYSKLVDRCVIGKAPIIYVASQVYGDSSMTSWLMMQLDYINNIVGASRKMTAIQIEQVARNILSNEDFHTLKVTDIMLFCNQFCCGKYGHFFGAVDGQVICSALYDYIRWKRQKIAMIMRDNKPKVVNVEEYITHEDYLKLVEEQKKKNKDEESSKSIQA